MYKQWRGEEWIENSIYMLTTYACPEMQDPKGCAAAVETYWGKIAAIIFSEEAGAHTCHALNDMCELPPQQRYYLI